MEEEQRAAMFNSWKEKHNRELKKCHCEIPLPRPTYLNECYKCNGGEYRLIYNGNTWSEIVDIKINTGNDKVL